MVSNILRIAALLAVMACIGGSVLLSHAAFLPEFLWRGVYRTKFLQADSLAAQFHSQEVLVRRIQCFDIMHHCGVHMIMTAPVTPEEFASTLRSLGWNIQPDTGDSLRLYTLLALDTPVKLITVNGSPDAWLSNRAGLAEPQTLTARKNKDSVTLFEKTIDRVLIDGRELNGNVVEIWINVRPN